VHVFVFVNLQGVVPYSSEEVGSNVYLFWLGYEINNSEGRSSPYVPAIEIKSVKVKRMTLPAWVLEETAAKLYPWIPMLNKLVYSLERLHL